MRNIAQLLLIIYCAILRIVDAIADSTLWIKRSPKARLIGLVIRSPYMVSSRYARPSVGETVTGLLPYIRPVIEGKNPSGLDEVRAYRPYRMNALSGAPGYSGFRYAGLTCLSSLTQCLRNRRSVIPSLFSQMYLNNL